MPKSNLCIIGLSKQLTDDICKTMSIKLDMFYANIEQIMEYELLDLQRIEEVCGKDYLFKEEKSIIKRISQYENTIINIDYASLNNDSNLNIIKNTCLLIYLHLDEKRFTSEISKEKMTESSKQIQLKMYKDRDFLCKNLSDIVIDVEDLNENQLTERLIENLIKYYT